MAEFDIFSPQISVVAKGMESKSAIWFGQNRTGKSRNACAMPKPCYLAFEDGLNAISGVPFFRMLTWGSYVKFVKQLTDPKNVEKAKEMYQTIIVDTVEAIGDACAQYVCNKFGFESLGDKRKTADGKIDFSINGYKELETEFQRYLRPLLLSGFTVIFIGHDTTREFEDEKGAKYSKIYPKGDKRIIDAICNAVDIIGYVVPNGIDPETGKEIKSSLLLANTQRALAGSRFDYLVPFLKEFTAQNLIDAVAKAVEEEEAASGIKAVTFAEQLKTKETETHRPLAEIKAEIEAIARTMFDETTGKMDSRYVAIIEDRLGKGASAMEAGDEKVEQLELALFDLKQLVEDKF